MAIRIDNDSAVFYGNRGVCYRKLGRVSEAIRDYSRAVELEPENTVFHYNRAVAYCDQLDYEQVTTGCFCSTAALLAAHAIHVSGRDRQCSGASREAGKGCRQGS